MKTELYELSENIYNKIKPDLKRANRDAIINSNGTLKTGHEGAKKGSFVYLLYSDNDELLYVGETGTTIKKRLKSDGSGAHLKTNPLMFAATKYILYYKSKGDTALSPMERKMIEQALTIFLRPKYYNKKEWAYVERL